MQVTRDEVRRIAALARLQLDHEELDRLTRQLSGILAHMDELRSLELGDVPPFTNAAEAAAALREDLPGADAMRTDIAGFAPAWRDGFFLVPRLAAQRGQGGDSGRPTDGDAGSDDEAAP